MKPLIQHRPLCLASSSPRRRDMLAFFGLEFTCHSPEILEVRSSGESIIEFVKRMSREKGRYILHNLTGIEENTIIMSGDTLVFLDQTILGKPLDERDAKAMLHQLSGQEHSVFSAYTLLDVGSGEEMTEWVRTRVVFRELSDECINWYTGTGEAMDKAGSYSIQGWGTYLVESITGSYNNVVGFPIEKILHQMLKRQWLSLANTS